MTQSKKDNTIELDGTSINLDSILDTSGDIVLNLDNYYTSNMNDVISIDNSTIGTISVGAADSTFTIDTTHDYNNVFTMNNDFGDIDSSKVERMCEHYPGLEKVWRNFKSVYDMCKQDYEGKKKAGELDDDIPF